MTEPVTTYRFTVEQYRQMGLSGVLREGDRVELIEGEIVTMSPIGSRHAACVKRSNQVFGNRLGSRVLIGVQDPLELNEHSEPEPDLCLLVPRPDFYASGHPRPKDILLAIEVADSSLDYDRDVKIPLYARAGIREAWLVDLLARRIEVYRLPSPTGYESVEIVAETGTIAPEAFPDVRIGVSEILP